ncbi:MAG: trypsin-like peptidase domain-containing protein [Planctomycetes bacterium]|nr:trypsin-like peptidase domain-containing protein [Planctomycetota bacterium]
MDRRQLVVDRTREIFADRLEDVLDMVRQDRQELRGWEEPAHVRAVLRRRLHEGGNESESSSVAVHENELARRAGEPDRGTQREGIGQLLEAGARGLERLIRRETSLAVEERLGLECVLLLYGRPAILLSQGRLDSVPSFWNILEDQREEVEMVQRGVGRIELLGHPDFDWAGTAMLVNENVLLTTRRTAESFVENREGNWQFRPGITTWMNYRAEHQEMASAGYRIRRVVGVHDSYDLAVLEVEPPQANQDGAPTPLVLAAQPPASLENRPVYMVGYPVRDARRNEPEVISRVCRDVYNVKRVQPGLLRNGFDFREVQLVRHDCGMLGQNSGSPIFDLETHQVLAMHLSGRYLESSTAIPLYALRDDPLLQRAGVTFSTISRQDLDNTTSQLERLARSRYWNEVRDTVANLYRRAFGNVATGPGNGQL